MAGSSLIGNLAVLLTMDTAAFEKGNSHAQKLLRSTQRQFENVAKKVYGVGQALSIGVTAPLVAFGTVAVREATEAAKAMGQVNAVLASMGPVAGKTADELKKAADAFETKSLFEADEILTKLTANLLTFGNVAGEQFDRAQQAAINMSARLGQDLQSSAIQVGKALNDPIKGITALQRVGIQFTAAQKEQIKALVEGGQAAKAQGIILAELERQFGGAAEAAQNTDPFNKMTDAFKQMAEQVGTRLVESGVIESFSKAIVSLVNAFSSLSPETQKWVIILGAVAAALGPVLLGVAGLISSFGIMLPLIVKIGPAFVALTQAIAAARIAALVLLPALAPIAVPIIAITAAVTAGYLAWKNWDKIAPIVGRMVGAIEGHLSRLKGILTAILNPVRTVQNAFATLYDRVVGNSYVPDMVDEIGAQMARLDAVMVQPITAATSKAAEAFRALQQETSNLLNRLFPDQAALNTFRNEIATLEEAMRKGILTAEQYAAALDKLKTEGLTDEPLGVLDQGSLVPGDETVLAGIDKALEKMGEVVDRSRDWRDVISQVAVDLGNIAGDFLSRFVEGSAKLKDLWRTVLSYAIQFFTSSNSPFMSLFGGARAAGGPVVGGRAYLVGENGPELFAPGVSGQVYSNQDTGRMLGGGNTWNIYTNDADSFRRSQRQIDRDTRRRLGVA